MSEPISDGLSWKDKLKFWAKKEKTVSFYDKPEPAPFGVSQEDINRVRAGTYKRFTEHEIKIDQDSAQTYFVRAVRKLQETNRWNEQAKQDLFEIAENASLKGHALVTRLPGRSNITHNQDVKNELMLVYGYNPDLAKAVARNRIVGGHATSSAALAGIIDHKALRARDELNNAGTLIASGEAVIGSATLNRDHLSCFQWISRSAFRKYTNVAPIDEVTLQKQIEGMQEVVEQYANTGYMFEESNKAAIEQYKKTLAFLQKPDKGEKEKDQETLIRENFPLVFFMSENATKKEDSVVPANSHIQGEYLLKGGVALGDLPIVLVPQKEVPYIEERFKKAEYDCQVFPIESHPAFESR